jgi:hypothetical protein
MQIALDSNDITCNGACDGEISVSATDGTPTYSYNWSNGATSASISGLCPGTYGVTVTDNGQCVKEYSISIAEPPVLSIQVSNDTTICAGSNVNISALASGGSGSISYSWDQGLGSGDTHTISPVSTTIYSVTVSDESNCEISETITVTVNDGLAPQITGNIGFCPGANTTLDAGVFQSFSWSTSETTQSIVVSVQGDYSVTVTDANGCTGVDMVAVQENPNPIPQISGVSSICPGALTSLDAGSFESYTWSTAESTQAINISAAGIYHVTVTDANGCSGSDMIEVSELVPPTPSITGESSFCAGESTVLSTDSYESYNWSTTETSQSISVSSTGDYTVTVEDLNGCTGIATISVTQDPAPAPAISGDLDFCAGTNTVLNAGNYQEYAWSTTETSQSITVFSGGTYLVTITDVNGCTGIDAVTVTENSSPAPEIIGDLEICPGESTLLDAGSYETYAWSTNEDSRIIIVTDPGEYIVTVTDLNGCQESASVTVVLNISPIVDISGSPEFCAGTETILDAGSFTNYLWSNSAISQSINVNTQGIYLVTVTDANGCTGEDEISVIELSNPIPEITGDQSICPGETVTLNTGSYSSYIWSNAATTQSISVNLPGIVGVTVTDQNSCTGERSDLL